MFVYTSDPGTAMPHNKVEQKCDTVAAHKWTLVVIAESSINDIRQLTLN